MRDGEVRGDEGSEAEGMVKSEGGEVSTKIDVRTPLRTTHYALRTLAHTPVAPWHNTWMFPRSESIHDIIRTLWVEGVSRG